MIRVVVSGGRGKTGRVVVAAIQVANDLCLVGETDLGDDLAATIKGSGAQVVVDFTEPGVALANTLTILEAGACPVIGTTGFTRAGLEEVSALCKETHRGAVIAPNFAIGAVLLMQLAECVARILPDVEIVELHHAEKRDKPSGTAMMTARRMEAVRENPRELSIPVHSVRLPGLVAHQEVIFGAPGQCLSIRHDIHDRDAFVPGVLLAVRRVLSLRHLVVGLDELLDTVVR